MKYIVITATMPPEKTRSGDTVEFSSRHPFVFPNHFVHAHVAKVMLLLVDLLHPGAAKVEVTSAGELNSLNFTGELFGKSDTLKLVSDPSDTQLLKMSDYGSAFSVGAERSEASKPVKGVETYKGFTLVAARAQDTGKIVHWIGKRGEEVLEWSTKRLLKQAIDKLVKEERRESLEDARDR